MNAGGSTGWSNSISKLTRNPSCGSNRAHLSPSCTSTVRRTRTNRFGAFCTSMPADWIRNTKGPALPSMIGTSPAVSSTNSVVDAEAGERRHQVLDRRDARLAGRQRRAERRLGHVQGARGHVGRRIEIGAAEHDARIGRRGTQHHQDLAAGMQADAGGADRLFQRALMDHGGVCASIISRPGRRPPASGGWPAADFPISRRTSGRVAFPLALGAPARGPPPRPQAQQDEPETIAPVAFAGHALPQSAWRRRKAGMSSTSSLPKLARRPSPTARCWRWCAGRSRWV